MIELRWLYKKDISEDHYNHPVLQYRLVINIEPQEFIWSYSPELTWSEWKDVPIVEEDDEEPVRGVMGNL